MGELEGIRGAWGYPEGGMGAVSDAIAKSAEASGADIITENSVKKVIFAIFYVKIHTVCTSKGGLCQNIHDNVLVGGLDNENNSKRPQFRPLCTKGKVKAIIKTSSFVPCHALVQ